MWGASISGNLARLYLQAVLKFLLQLEVRRGFSSVTGDFLAPNSGFANRISWRDWRTLVGLQTVCDRVGTWFRKEACPGFLGADLRDRAKVRYSFFWPTKLRGDTLIAWPNA